jgi:hypothetical protein
LFQEEEVEILDIKRGAGYKARDIFDEGNELFIYDKSFSETVKNMISNT